MLFHLHHEIVLKFYYASFSYLTLFLVNLINSPVIIRTLSPSITYYTLSPHGDLVAYTYLSFHITNVLFAHFFPLFVALTLRKGFYKHEVFFFNSFINNLIFHNLLALSFPLLLFKLGFIALPTNNDSSILLTEFITWVKLLTNALYFLLLLSILLTLSLRAGAIRLTRIIYTLTLFIIFSATLPTLFNCFILSFTLILFLEIRVIVNLIYRKLDENNSPLWLGISRPPPRPRRPHPHIVGGAVGAAD